MAETPQGPTFPRGVKPWAVYTYRNAAEEAVLVIARWHDADTTRPEGYKKRFTQHTIDPESGKWTAKNPRKNADGSPRLNLLYDLPSILDDLTAPILVVEGEKSAHGAIPLLPRNWVVTTWPGGAGAVKNADWTPLRGRRVVVWPDNDVPGIKAAHDVGRQLGGDVAVVAVPEYIPDGWDLGDPLPDGLTPDDVEAMILGAEVPPAEGPEMNGHHMEAVAPRGVPIPKYRCLGYTPDGKFFFISNRTQNIHSFTSKDIRSGNALRDLEPNELHWVQAYGQGKADWKGIGDSVIAQSYAIGVYNEQRVRARGVWLDQDRVVAHLGDRILINGAAAPTLTIESRFIYPVDDPLLPPDAPLDTKPLDAEGGAQLINVCRSFEWANKASGDLLAGVLATSCICGALQFRTHAWLTGPAGSGKSYAMENVIAKALDGVALHILGNSSEAGIRRHLSRDARPAIYDEAEGEGPAGRQRRDMIIALMRASSTETKARILLGSGGARGESFPVRAQFILGSVGTGLERATDLTRCLVLTLKGRQPINQDERKKFALHFATLQSEVNALPKHLSTQLFLRMLGMVDKVRANAEVFRKVIAEKLASARVGDQVGTVLAGAYALYHDEVVTEDEAIKNLNRLKLEEWTHASDPEAQDEGSLFNHMAAHQIKAEYPGGIETRTIGELCAVATGSFSKTDTITDKTARRNLARVGISYDEMHRGFWFANKHQQLARILSTSQFPQGYVNILQRVQGSMKSDNSMYFGGVMSRGTFIPEKFLVPAIIETDLTAPAFEFDER